MTKTFLLHDLEEAEARRIIAGAGEDSIATFSCKPAVRHCVGCFNCWLKTPGICTISDRAQTLTKSLSEADRVVIVSRLVFGSYSPEVKAALDRSIGYVLPFFRIIDNQMHHTLRYDDPFALTVHFYGGAHGKDEEALARKLVAANAVNLGVSEFDVLFHDRPSMMAEAI